MHHETIAADTDPDLEQAKVDLLPYAEQIRALSKRMVAEPADSRERTHLQAEIRRQMEFIIVRADRLAISADGLMMLLAAELDSRTRRGRPAPTRETRLTLMSKRDEILLRVTEAEQQAKAWQERHLAELDALAALDDAMRLAGYAR